MPMVIRFTSQGSLKYILMSVQQADTGNQKLQPVGFPIVQLTVFLATSTSQKKETV
ncbi:MAG: hypothetical protein FD168_2314 [Desulfobulbaceae bacterium]|nr:MAG: hypothetical protein FD168_2314 [Desulfobulbaceae bacterium]